MSGNQGRADTERPRPPLAAYIGVPPALVILALAAYSMRGSFMDDAYISLEYVSNLVAGKGMVFQAGERIEGITNIGWALFLAPFALVLGPTLAAKVLGFALAALCLALAANIAAGRVTGLSPWVVTAPLPFFIVLNRDFTIFALNGMETAFLSALILLAAMAIARRRLYLAAGLMAWAFLAHPEAALVFPLFVAAMFILDPDARRKLAGPAALFFAAVLVFTLARHLYYGDILPNTFAAKPAAPREAAVSALNLLRGANANVSFPLNSALALPLVALGAFRLGREDRRLAAFLSAALAAGYVFSIYARPDWTGMGRYFAPYLPPGLVLFWAGAVELAELAAERFSMPSLHVHGIAVMAVLLMAATGAPLYSALSESYRERYPGYVLFAEDLAEPAREVCRTMPEGAVIATRRIGALGFYCEREIFDYKFGLVDREVAAVRREVGEDFGYPDHPALARLWSARSPDYLLEDSPIIEHLQGPGAGDGDVFEVHGVAYREVRRFKIGARVDWVLCEKVRRNLSSLHTTRTDPGPRRETCERKSSSNWPLPCSR